MEFPGLHRMAGSPCAVVWDRTMLSLSFRLAEPLGSSPLGRFFLLGRLRPHHTLSELSLVIETSLVLHLCQDFPARSTLLSLSLSGGTFGLTFFAGLLAGASPRLS